MKRTLFAEARSAPPLPAAPGRRAAVLWWAFGLCLGIIGVLVFQGMMTNSGERGALDAPATIREGAASPAPYGLTPSAAPVLFALALLGTNGLTMMLTRRNTARARPAGKRVEAPPQPPARADGAASEALERSNRELDDFAYIASHDLKAPLRSIMQITEWIAEDLAAGDHDDLGAHLAALRGRAARMSRLLEDLLDHMLIGRKPLDGSERIVTGRTMRRAIEGLVPPRNGIVLQFDPLFDSLKVKQMPVQRVLANLVQNASKHHDKPRGTIRVTQAGHGGRLLFRVEDDGPGIRPEYHQRIFGMFQTLQPRDQVEGSGMGLCIAAKHVALAQGDIGVLSAGDGTGSVFWFTWPALDAQGTEGRNT